MSGGLPGGAMDVGESVGQAVVRASREETGFEVRPTTGRRRLSP
jgi:8-oxo-dGTP pyrophosphatase MutT (NUDIX family)